MKKKFAMTIEHHKKIFYYLYKSFIKAISTVDFSYLFVWKRNTVCICHRKVFFL